MRFSIEAIGTVRGGRSDPVDDGWGAVTAGIELVSAFDAEALAGLEDFSHVEILYLFDRIGPDEIVTGTRHPRGRTDWPRVGIFAQRGRNRPNRIGVSICRLTGVRGRRVDVMGLDAIDGTPVIDIKPVMRGFLPRGELREPDWAREIMKNYW